MNFLTERIAKDGLALNEDVLLVDSFLNHQIDMELMRKIGLALAEHFADQGITRILTVESSGIAPAAMVAMAMDLPLVVIKKKTSKILGGDVYQTTIRSFTKGTSYEATVSKKYLPAGERVLLIDDFLAVGNAVLGVKELVEQAGCTLVGAGIVIEKTFQEGRAKLDDMGINVFSLARISHMEEGKIEFLDD